MRAMICLAMLLFAAHSSADEFPITCHPYGVERQPIDQQCGLQGAATASPANHAQNRAKNNLCATGTPKRLRQKTLKALQKAVDATGLAYGHHPGPPASRSALTTPIVVGSQTFAEGDLVYFVGYISDAHAAGAETSNCGAKKPDVDVHFALSEKKLKFKKKEPKPKRDAKLCKSFGAELIPHLRPEMWEAANIKDLEKEQAIVKVSGQLFFDGSHQPCVGKAPRTGDPARFTVWEIHPIYDLQVCKHDSMSKCSPSDGSVWQSVKEWEAEPDHDEQ
jgi:hypothetical protein